MDIGLGAGRNHTHNVKTGHHGIVYVVSGQLSINKQPLNEGQALLFREAETLNLESQADTAIMLATGTPHNEPIIQYGPYVD